MNFLCNDQETVVSTAKGRLKGYRFGNVYAFKGIPYATAKRFRAPEEVEAWNGIQDALCYGYTCPTMWESGLSDYAETTIPHQFWPKDENCLNLNVWTKSIDPGVKRPVVVWLHGGGFFQGSAVAMPDYDGHNLCDAEDLVVVSVNHRTNILGYMDLRKFGPEYTRSVNVGNLDLIAALQWIHNNIALFGGDADNVTLFGQSGGGGKILSLMNMPAAQSLFHKALVMSGTLSGPVFEDDRDLSPVVRRTIALLGGQGDDVSTLENADYPALADAYTQAYREITEETGIPFFAPMVNCDYPGNPMSRGFTEGFKKIPLMLGSTYGEFSAHPSFADGKSDKEIFDLLKDRCGAATAQEALAAFRAAYSGEPAWQIMHLDTDAFRPHKKRLAMERADTDSAPTYLYLFTPTFCLNSGNKAWHCADIPYFFHNVDRVPSENLGQDSRKLENAMAGAFANFARTGVPSHPDLPLWPACEKGREMTMVLDIHPRVAENFDSQLLKILQPLRLFSQIVPVLLK